MSHINAGSAVRSTGWGRGRRGDTGGPPARRRWRRAITATTVVCAMVALSLTSVGIAAADTTGTPGVDAGVLTWGSGSQGALGNGQVGGSQFRPAPYAGPNLNFTQISMTGTHALALADDGTVWGWGSNTRRQILAQDRLHSPIAYPTPIQVPMPGTVRQVATGGGSSLIVTTAGSVYAWGRDLARESNDDPFLNDIGEPNLVGGFGLGDIVQVSLYATHALLLSADGSVYAWGDNPDGVLGTGDTNRRTQPTKINGLPPISTIATGLRHSLAAARNGLVYAWGDNSFGQLGLGPDGPSRHTTPTPVLGLSATPPIKQLVAGFQHSLALFTNGDVFAWGDDSEGQLGDSAGGQQPLPVRTQISNVSSIAAGPFANLALQGDHVWAWGENLSGQLGDGTNLGPRPTPFQVPDLSGAEAIAMGLFASAASVSQPASLSMTLSPALATANAGDSVSTTVSFTASRGVAGRPVNLSIAPLPLGVTAGLSDSAPDPGGTSTLVMKSNRSGVFQITVVASAGTIFHLVLTTVTFELTVRPDFAVALTPANGTVSANGSVTTQVRLTSGTGFTGTANLAVDGLPGGTTAALNTTQVSVANPATLILICTSTPFGTYDIHVTATTADGTQSRSATFELNVTGPPGRDGN